MVMVALLYHLQTRDGMYDYLKPYVLLSNIALFTWFVTLQFYRFMPNGSTCSGDFMNMKGAPANMYLKVWGLFIVAFIILFYFVSIYIILVSIKINNKHKRELEKKSAMVMNQV